MERSMTKRRTADQWRALIAEQQASGQTASAFCRARGIDPTWFSNRKRTLAKTGGNFALVARVPAATQAPGDDVEIALGAFRMRVTSSVSPRWLGQVLQEWSHGAID
jgi:hypothetical protein